MSKTTIRVQIIAKQNKKYLISNSKKKLQTEKKITKFIFNNQLS